MKRAVILSMVLVMVVMIVAIVVAGNWLLRTTDGARWALRSLSSHTPLQVSAVKVEGRLLDHLRLEGVRVQTAQKTAQVDHLNLQWRLLPLLAGKLVVDELLIAGIRVEDETPASGKPPDLSWPRLPAKADLLEVEINRLQINNLSYRHLDGKPLQLQEVSTAIFWKNAVLSLPAIAISAKAGQLNGKLMAGFHRPSLSLDLAIKSARALAGMNLINISGRLLPARGPEQLAGKVNLTGSSKGAPRLEAQAELGIMRKALNLRRLQLVRPGRRGSITGEGTVSLDASEPVVNLSLAASDLDLARELNLPTDLSGKLTLAGSSERYHGRFSIKNQGKDWQAASLAADFRGGGEGLSLAPLSGSMLGGEIRGELAIGWVGGISAKGVIRGRNLDPARLHKRWTGNVNFDADGEVLLPEKGQLQGEADVVLLDSRLHGQALTGKVRGAYTGNNLQLTSLDLHGKGFDLRGSGNLARRLDLAAKVSDLSLLVPGTAGELQFAGWGSWSKGRGAGAISGSGGGLKADGIDIDSIAFHASLPPGKEQALSIAAALQEVGYQQFQTDSVKLEVNGKVPDHTISLAMAAPEASISLAFGGGYSHGSWQGKINHFTARDRLGPWNLLAPARLAIGSAKVTLAPLIIAGPGRERLEAEGSFTTGPGTGKVRMQWGDLNLTRINPWLKEMQISGFTSGELEAALLPDKHLSFRTDVQCQGKVTREGQTITLERAMMKTTGNGSGIKADLELRAAEGLLLQGKIATATPARLALPEQGTLDLNWKVADLAALQPWIKGNVKVSGLLTGGAKGRFLPGNHLELEGGTELSGGKLHWQKPEGEASMDLKAVSAKWSWRGDKLRGTLGLSLARYGQARGNFELPVPARLPISPEPKGAVSAILSGQVQEQGVLSAFMPGLVQESHGLVDVDISVSGEWQEPRLSGKLQLAQAGAYLPSAGIQLRDVALAANLEKDQVRISFQARSGSGNAHGEGLAQLKGWQVESYRGTISGDRFQAIHLPELEASASPQLTFDGTMKKLVLRGEVRLPDLIIKGQPAKATIEPSPDVILEGETPAKKALPLALDVQVRVTLGDRVLVKAEGLDAKLGGSMDLTLTSLDNIISKGEIKVVKGRYKAYGLDLAIARGRIFYAGGTLNQPLLDILALRTVDEVRAGVTVSGTPRTPVIKLYSEPAMPDMDILAYIVLGHPLGSSGEQAGLVAQAAGLLLSTGQSVVLQDQIKNRLGLSTIEIESGRQDAAAKMGYKEIPISPNGAATAKEADNVSQSILTLGKYLTPQLYISYGRSLFTGGNLFRLRYDISRRLQLETETGTESGVDLYYKMYFN